MTKLLRRARRKRAERNDSTAQDLASRIRRRAGISLVEMMIALAILAFGILGAAAAQIASIKFNRTSQTKMEAYFLAEQQIEAFQSMPGTAIDAIALDGAYPNDPNNPLDSDPNDGKVRSFARTWDIAADTPEAGMYTISVTVGWTDGNGDPQSVTVETMKTGS